jgi:hypothetical protein
MVAERFDSSGEEGGRVMCGVKSSGADRGLEEAFGWLAVGVGTVELGAQGSEGIGCDDVFGLAWGEVAIADEGDPVVVEGGSEDDLAFGGELATGVVSIWWTLGKCWILSRGN